MRKIQPRNNNGSLLIRFKHKGKEYSLAGFGRYDDKLARSRAEQVCIQLQMDIASNNFDPTLEKYGKVKVEVTDKPELLADKPLPLPSEAIGDYYDYRAKLGDCSTTHLEAIAIAHRCFKAIEAERIMYPPDLINAMVARCGYATIAKHWTILNLAYDWLELNGKIASNPYRPLRKLLPTKKMKEESSREDADIDPFTPEERDRILQWFKADKHANHLYLLVEFLFYIGCRPSEAIPLRWKDVKDGKIHFTEVITEHEQRDRLKTQKSRVVSIPSQLAYLKSEHTNPEALIFPASDDEPVNWTSFRNNQWKRCLASLGIRHRKPYQMRHTFITEAIKKGISSTLIAKHCGNSTEMIEKHYLGDVSDVSISL